MAQVLSKGKKYPLYTNQKDNPITSDSLFPVGSILLYLSPRTILFFPSFFHPSYAYILFFFLFVVNFVIHWNETAMGLHVFPILIPPPTSLSTRSP